MVQFSIEKIEEKIDQVKAGAVPVSSDVGGIQFSSMGEVMEFAKMVSVAGQLVPEHLRGNPGACLAIVIQALEWRMSPFAVANKSYIAKDRVAYESQLIHAVIESRAPLKSRLRYEIIGEGDERRCKVWGTFKGETEPHVFVSDTVTNLRPKRNERGEVRGSPLWDTKPEVQLFYNASRDWARMFCPDVILGVYAVDELPEEPRDVTPNANKPSRATALVERLKTNKRKTRGGGFNGDHVEKQANDLRGGSTVIEGKAETPPAPVADPVAVARERGLTDAKAGVVPGSNIDDLRQPGRDGELDAYMEAFTDAKV